MVKSKKTNLLNSLFKTFKGGIYDAQKAALNNADIKFCNSENEEVINLGLEIQKGCTVKYTKKSKVTSNYFMKENNFLAHEKYFKAICKAICDGTNSQVRKMAVKDVTTNCRVWPIMGWFYNFIISILNNPPSYACISYVLDLLEALECSLICRIRISEHHIKGVTTLLYNQILFYQEEYSVLWHMCALLEVLCRREQVYEFVLSNLVNNFQYLMPMSGRSILAIASVLGAEAIMRITINNIELLLDYYDTKPFDNLILQIYHYMCISTLYSYISPDVYEMFSHKYGGTLTAFNAIDIQVDPTMRHLGCMISSASVFRKRRRRKILYRQPAHERKKADITLCKTFFSDPKRAPLIQPASIRKAIRIILNEGRIFCSGSKRPFHVVSESSARIDNISKKTRLYEGDSVLSFDVASANGELPKMHRHIEIHKDDQSTTSKNSTQKCTGSEIMLSQPVFTPTYNSSKSHYLKTYNYQLFYTI